SELQQWLDAAEAENEKLKEKLAQLERGGGAGGTVELEKKLHESEEHAEALRREVAELKCIVAAEESELHELQLHVPTPHVAHADDAKTAELQSWLDAAEKENEALRAKLEAGGGGSSGDDALQQRLAEAEAQVEALKREVVELKCVVAAEESELNELHLHEGARTHAPVAGSGGDAKVAELQSWLDAAEQENVRLRAELAKAKPETVGTGSAEEEYLRERLSEVEAALHSMKGLNARFAEQIETSSKRDIERLKAELATAKAKGDPTKLHELEDALELAQESVATLTAERAAAIDQVRRYVGTDEGTEAEKKHAAELAKKDKRITDLEAEVMGQAEDLHGFRQRISAWETRDAEMQQQVDDLRKRACDAEAKAAEVQGALERTEAREAEKDARLADLERKSGESERWLAQAELDAAALQKELDALKLEKALTGKSAEPGDAPGAQPQPPPPPPQAVVDGFDESAAIRALKLERQLEAEREAASALRRFADVSERALDKAKDELELAHARLKDLKHRLGDSDAEAGEALDRLYGTQKELDALRAELSRALHDSAAAPESADDAIVEEHEVKAAVAGPLSAMEQLGEEQAKAAKEATDALLAEQKARDALLGDLQWLKAEVEKLSNVREDLRHRIAAMVKRELDRKAQLARLLAKLRENEVTSATRLSAVRRLQAAVELSQRMAVKVQTVYFQKQIGSLSKQLEKEKKAKLSVVKKPAA
ncbi:MAG: hypothetical protein ABTQ32_11565, partial [Myxococcaceae bacterium]